MKQCYIQAQPGVLGIRYLARFLPRYSVFCAKIFRYRGILYFNNASVNSSCSHPPPPGNCRTFACLVSPGGGALANLARPGGRAFTYPRAFDTRGFQLKIQTWRILSQRTSSSLQIGSSVKDWTNLWRFSRFYAFLHCLSRHNYLTFGLINYHAIEISSS